MAKTVWEYLRRLFKQHITLYNEVDTDRAAERIKSAIWFRGPNVWILAFSIIIASVGLNVNSTAVIIGAMLISPLMGPIIGMGLALGTNDTDLLKSAVKNLLVMVVISLTASTLFFLLSPLSLVNPTELEARTSPTIYDVLIALFGGLAGILENSRKEQGTAIAGVAIATALMPPLCTAGFGLAHGNFAFFFGALYLFVINSVFIALATYLMVRYLRFRTVAGISPEVALKRRRIFSSALVIFLIPSIWSAVVLIKDNNFQRNVNAFTQANRMAGPRSYIYDCEVSGRHATFSIAGEPLSDSLKTVFYQKAAQFGIKEKNLTLSEHSFGMSQQDMDSLIEEIYTTTSNELDENQALLESMEARLEQMSMELQRLRAVTDSLLGPAPLPEEALEEEPVTL